MHTLNRTEQWIYGKSVNSIFVLGLVGLWEFREQRQAVAGDVLHLDAWFGQNEVIYFKPLQDFRQYEVKFNLGEQSSQLFTYLDCDKESCWTFRLSTDPRLPSGLYRVSHQGKFLETKLISRQGTIGDHRLRIENYNSKLAIFLDDEFIVENPIKGNEFPLRFRSGDFKLTIQEIKVTQLDGQIKKINFKKPFSWPYFLSTFLLQLVLVAFMGMYFRSDSKRFYKILYLQTNILVLALVFYSVDRFFWSNHYLTANLNPEGNMRLSATIYLESLRNKAVDWWDPNRIHRWNYTILASQMGWLSGRDFSSDPGLLSAQFNKLQTMTSQNTLTFSSMIDPKPQTRDFRVAFLGGSQTWGAGASAGEYTFPSIVVQGLKGKLNRNIHGVNFAKCAWKLENILTIMPELLSYNPHLVVLNFGLNDYDTKAMKFESQFLSLINSLQRKTTKILVVVEPFGSDRPNHAQKRNQIKKMAKENHIHYFDLADIMQAPEQFQTGIIWHDLAHFTDYGHELAAKLILNSESLAQLLVKKN